MADIRHLTWAANIPSVAEHLGYSRQHVARLVRAGTMDSVCANLDDLGLPIAGTKRLIPPAEIARWERRIIKGKTRKQRSKMEHQATATSRQVIDDE